MTYYVFAMVTTRRVWALGELAGPARKKYSKYAMYAQLQEGSLPIVTVYTCQNNKVSEKLTVERFDSNERSLSTQEP